MIRFSVVVIFLIIAAAGCSSPQPPQSFLDSKMRIITGVSQQNESGVETEVLKMKPTDLFNVFDRDVRSKKWEKVHDNSWKLIVKGKDPVNNIKTTFEFSLVTVPQLNNDIVVKNIVVNGVNYNSVRIIETMRYLDKGFNAVK